MADMIFNAASEEAMLRGKLRQFEEREFESDIAICFYHETSRTYLGFNTAAEPYRMHDLSFWPRADYPLKTDMRSPSTDSSQGHDVKGV
jgi:hypothetical protein